MVSPTDFERTMQHTITYSQNELIVEALSSMSLTRCGHRILFRNVTDIDPAER